MHALTLSTYITVLSTVIEITQASYVLSFLNTQNQLIILRLSDTYTARTALVEKKKGLGVTITNKLTRNSHIHNIVVTSKKLKQMFLYKKIERQCR
jgi:L-rhamnose isomerase